MGVQSDLNSKMKFDLKKYSFEINSKIRTFYHLS